MTYDVVLLPTFIQVEAWRKEHALARGGLFGQVVSTFDAWVADLWELHGDGRRLVNSVQRSTAMRAAFAQIAQQPGKGGHAGAGEEASLTLSPGLAPLAARCEMAGAGIAEFDAAVGKAASGGVLEGLEAREALFLRGIARYRRLLAGLGLVEPGEACALLARDGREVFPRQLSVLVEQAAPFTWRMRRFFEACPQLAVRVHPAPGADGVRRLPDGIAPVFAHPSGGYAVPGMVASLVRDALGKPVGGGWDDAMSRVVICSPDPLALYKELEPAFAREGVAAGVQAQTAFAMTDFGRAFALSGRLAIGDTWDAADVADLLHSPFSGVSASQARAADARLRSDRLVQREACLQELADAHGGFATLLALAGDDAPRALDAAESISRELPRRSQAWRSEQLAAIAAARAVGQVASELGLGIRDVMAVLESTVVTVSYRGVAPGGGGAPQVLITTQGAAAQRVPGSCEVLVATGLTAADFPLSDADDAASTLFGKLGLEAPDDALSRARRTFRALQGLPRRSFVCMRPLNDIDGNPAYPCAMLEELLDAYRVEPGADPAVPAPFERGEELLYANARAADPSATQPVGALVEVPAAGSLPAASASALLPARRLPDGGVLRRSPSPSQLELYLECPYKWFVQRRLGVQGLEEGFGALERGTFAHEVLERFYRRFAQEVGPKVAPDALARAKGILRSVADEVEREMHGDEPGSGRFVAATRLEERELAQFKEQLADYLEFESRLLPGFHPAYLEYAFDAQHAVEYAGCPIVGTVDRIDVDDAGHAVIIDYKGSVGAEHGIGGKGPSHPGKIQTRIYAQMVKRALGLDVVGALYVSYGRPGLSGAADPRVLETPHLPESRGDAIWCGLHSAMDAGDAVAMQAPFADLAFSDMLDATEAVVANAVARMEAGDIAPNPASSDACRYCPVAACPKKGA